MTPLIPPTPPGSPFWQRAALLCLFFIVGVDFRLWAYIFQPLSTLTQTRTGFDCLHLKRAFWGLCVLFSTLGVIHLLRTNSHPVFIVFVLIVWPPQLALYLYRSLHGEPYDETVRDLAQEGYINPTRTTIPLVILRVAVLFVAITSALAPPRFHWLDGFLLSLAFSLYFDSCQPGPPSSTLRDRLRTWAKTLVPKTV